jgi:hypothetical protein
MKKNHHEDNTRVSTSGAQISSNCCEHHHPRALICFKVGLLIFVLLWLLDTSYYLQRIKYWTHVRVVHKVVPTHHLNPKFGPDFFCYKKITRSNSNLVQNPRSGEFGYAVMCGYLCFAFIRVPLQVVFCQIVWEEKVQGICFVPGKWEAAIWWCMVLGLLVLTQTSTKTWAPYQIRIYIF